MIFNPPDSRPRAYDRRPLIHAPICALRQRSSRRGASMRSVHDANALVGPRHRNSSTSRNKAASVLSVARSLNRSARSRRSPSTAGGKFSIVPCRFRSCAAVIGSDPGNAWIPVRRIADEREEIGNQAGLDAELLANALLRLAIFLPFAVDLHHSVAADALRQILVGCPDANLLHALDLRRLSVRRRQARRRPRARSSATRRRPSRRALLPTDGIAREARARCQRPSCSRARGGCETIR